MVVFLLSSHLFLINFVVDCVSLEYDLSVYMCIIVCCECVLLCLSAHVRDCRHDLVRSVSSITLLR